MAGLAGLGGSDEPCALARLRRDRLCYKVHGHGDAGRKLALSVIDIDRHVVFKGQLVVGAKGRFASAKLCPRQTVAHAVELRAVGAAPAATALEIVAPPARGPMVDATGPPEERPCHSRGNRRSKRFVCGLVVLGGLRGQVLRPHDSRFKRRVDRALKRRHEDMYATIARVGFRARTIFADLTRGECYRAIAETRRGHTLQLEVRDTCGARRAKRSRVTSARVDFCAPVTGTWRIKIRATRGAADGPWALRLLRKRRPRPFVSAAARVLVVCPISNDR